MLFVLSDFHAFHSSSEAESRDFTGNVRRKNKVSRLNSQQERHDSLLARLKGNSSIF